jgi:hypothetical protein
MDGRVGIYEANNFAAGSVAATVARRGDAALGNSHDSRAARRRNLSRAIAGVIISDDDLDRLSST